MPGRAGGHGRCRSWTASWTARARPLAATGQRIPTRFNTFFYGLGLTKSLVGAQKARVWIMRPPTSSSRWKPFKKKMNVFSGSRVMVDDNPNFQHWSGRAAPRHRHFAQQDRRSSIPRRSTRRWRMSSAAARASSPSRRPVPAIPSRAIPAWAAPTTLPAEASPLSLYTRLFGPGFQDPVQDRLETRSRRSCCSRACCRWSPTSSKSS